MRLFKKKITQEEYQDTVKQMVQYAYNELGIKEANNLKFYAIHLEHYIFGNVFDDYFPFEGIEEEDLNELY